MNELSYLGASGFTKTSNDLYEYLSKVVIDIKSKLPLKNKVKAHLWSYRHDGRSVISFDLKELEKHYPITITICAESNYDYLDEPEFSDISEAMHMIGILTKSLSLEVEIGRTCNETNQKLVSKPFSENQTSGELKLLN